MPEMPEVETVVQDLRKSGLEGRKIANVEIHWPRTVGKPSVSEFVQSITKSTILSVGRRGKFITFHLSNKKYLFVHLRMTGRFLFSLKPTEVGPYDRIVLKFEDGSILKFHDTRKFGRWYLVSDEIEITGNLGPEPLDDTFTISIFQKALTSKKRQLKPLLLDQSFLAGLGNIYVDEALWLAKLHPLRLSDSLSTSEIKQLYKSIQEALRRGLETQGTTLGKGKSNFYRLDGGKGSHQDKLNVFRKTGLPCPRCQTPIVRLVVAQRSTHICPNCQKNL